MRLSRGVGNIAAGRPASQSRRLLDYEQKQLMCQSGANLACSLIRALLGVMQSQRRRSSADFTGHLATPGQNATLAGQLRKSIARLCGAESLADDLA